MNRIKKHRIKEEKASTSSINKRTPEEHDLAYFIHDRVELMHQVFSVLKSKELKSLAPDCVRRLSIDDLQELCLEELLGISSKRLCAILDGAEPPSDTESSSQSADQLETISLDSISSDDEILSQSSGKKKKHKHRHSKKKKRKKSKGSGDEQGETRASRAGLTVLELLELQARARAIRAQLHQEPTKVQETAAEPPSSDNDEVLIKEEPAEVVEISSDDEKPDVERLQKEIGSSAPQTKETEVTNNGDPQAVTKRINDLIITVPQSKPTRKIKLKRQKPTETVTTQKTPEKVTERVVETTNAEHITVTVNTSKNSGAETKKASNVEAKNKIKKTKKKKKKAKEKEGSDEDEITIQLSDTEKMDLLEDLDAKNFDTVSSSNTDSDSSDSSDSDDEDKIDNGKADKEKSKTDEEKANASKETETVIVNLEQNEVKKDDEIRGYVSKDNNETVEINDLPIVADETTPLNNDKDDTNDLNIVDKQSDAKDDISAEIVECTNEEKPDETGSNKEKPADISTNEKSDCAKADDPANQKTKSEEAASQKTKSEGEISDRESSEVEASDVQAEVVCISDDEGKKKKKKKKEKKSKKEKKTKSGFRQDRDENFYKDKKTEAHSSEIETIDDDDDVYEYLEISDDSSCYEVEGVSVLSKEPTAEEIEAFSARMDEIEIDREETIPTEESRVEFNESGDIENVSWKDRYLGSKKVKRVLTTANILNAIRKKNIELKKKLEEAKRAEKTQKEAELEKDATVPTVEDGTIEQYETLQGSTKYVDPVKEIEIPEVNKEENKAEGNQAEENKAVENKAEENKAEENQAEETKDVKEDAAENVTKEMKKDAKMLLKMYKRLLKYNVITKQKDPNKKKKKKQKKNKEKAK